LFIGARYNQQTTQPRRYCRRLFGLSAPARTDEFIGKALLHTRP